MMYFGAAILLLLAVSGFAVVRTQGALSDGAVDLALRMFELSPHIKQGWLDNHRAFQELAWTATAESEGS